MYLLKDFWIEFEGSGRKNPSWCQSMIIMGQLGTLPEYLPENRMSNHVRCLDVFSSSFQNSGFCWIVPLVNIIRKSQRFSTYQGCFAKLICIHDYCNYLPIIITVIARLHETAVANYGLISKPMIVVHLIYVQL